MFLFEVDGQPDPVAVERRLDEPQHAAPGRAGLAGDRCGLRRRIMRKRLELYLADSVDAWLLQPDGHLRAQGGTSVARAFGAGPADGTLWR